LRGVELASHVSGLYLRSERTLNGASSVEMRGGESWHGTLADLASRRIGQFLRRDNARSKDAGSCHRDADGVGADPVRRELERGTIRIAEKTG
jgi:hypothetical protein